MPDDRTRSPFPLETPPMPEVRAPSGRFVKAHVMQAMYAQYSVVIECHKQLDRLIKISRFFSINPPPA